MQPLKNNKFRINKSRYDSIDSYLSCCGEKYNDIELTIDDEVNKQLLDAGKRTHLRLQCVRFAFDTPLGVKTAEAGPCLFSSALFCTVAGIDKLLAQHIAHLFIRDPLSLFQEKIHLDDENESDHFEVFRVHI